MAFTLGQQEHLPRTAPPNYSDHIFKTINGLDLSLRVWPADPALATEVRAPFALWTHGGSYLVAHSYRLAPEARIDESLADCIDTLVWCRENLPDIVGVENVDVDRFVVCGDSSGGTLVTLLGYYMKPPPRVVIDVYGLVDFKAMGWLREAQREDAESAGGNSECKGEFTEAELIAFLGDRNPSNALSFAPPWISRYTEEQLSEAWNIDFRYTKRVRMQTELHLWRKERGRRGLKSDLLRAIMHNDKFTDRNNLVDFVSSVTPLRLLEGKTSYPPTAFLHGTSDMVVPVSRER